MQLICNGLCILQSVASVGVAEGIGEGEMAEDQETRPIAAESSPEVAPPRQLSAAAQRALAEAEERRQKQEKRQNAPEVGGRDGPDPARYGDWEVNGIASDF